MLMRVLLVFCSLLLPMFGSAQNLIEQPSRAHSEHYGPRFGKKFWTSVAVLGAATFADAYSSRGRIERNPLLQGADGRFSVGRGLTIKSATAAGLVTVEMLMIRQHPGREAERISTLTNFVSAGVFAGTAVYNSQNHRSSRSSVPTYLGGR